MDDKKSLLTTLPPLLVAVGTLITAVIGLGNFMSSPAPSITEFEVSPSIIDAGGNATLKWTVSGDASSVSIDPGIGTVALSGSRMISPDNTTNYTLTANNKGQVKTASAQLIVRAVKADHNSIQESNNSSVQKPAPISFPSSANKNLINNPNNANNANISNSAINANTINATNAVETTGKDKSAISGGLKPSGSNNLASKDMGDEPIKMSSLESASKSKETSIRTNSSNSNNNAVGDEPIQTIEPKNTSIRNASKTLNAVNQTGPTKAASTTTETPSKVGDIA